METRTDNLTNCVPNDFHGCARHTLLYGEGSHSDIPWLSNKDTLQINDAEFFTPFRLPEINFFFPTLVPGTTLILQWAGLVDTYK